jgi:hypothetical protein
MIQTLEAKSINGWIKKRKKNIKQFLIIDLILYEFTITAKHFIQQGGYHDA